MSQTIETLIRTVRRWQGLAPCCGTTNPHCSTPMLQVSETLTGCEKCGHPKGCHR